MHWMALVMDILLSWTFFLLLHLAAGASLDTPSLEIGELHAKG